MTETNKRQDLVATLRDALRTLEDTLGRMREGVDAIASQAVRLRASVEGLGEFQPRADITVGIDMCIDAATAFLEAFSELDAGILDVQTAVDTLAAERTDGEDDRET